MPSFRGESGIKLPSTGYLGWGQTTYNRNGIESAKEAWTDARAKLVVSEPMRRVMRVMPMFAWYDMWVGLFWDRKKRTFASLMPMIRFDYIDPRLKREVT